MARKLIFLVWVTFVSGLGLLFLPSDIHAMPNFARKYNADCSMCHTAVPKLNQIGYEFRLAGYRLPFEIGKEEKPFNLAEFFAARLQFDYKWLQHSDVSSGKSSNTNNLEFHEFTLYPLTGSWGSNFGSLAELSMSPDDVFEVENAFVRGVYGNQDGWFQARAGIMHPWEGFGASDRPIGNMRPLFQKNAAKGSPFILWNLDEPAIELGYHYVKTGTTISGRVSNGIIWKEDASGSAEPAQGGGLTKAKKGPGHNDKSFQFVLNQFITNSSGVTLYYYHGVVPFPDPNFASTTRTTRDNFQRFAAYANHWLWADRLNLLAGYGYGNDSLKDRTVKSTDAAVKYDGSKVGNSQGVFGELDYHVSPKLAFGFRYDFFDPSNKATHNNLNAFTLSGNYSIWNGLQAIADYQHKNTEVTGKGNTKENQILLRLIFIF